MATKGSAIVQFDFKLNEDKIVQETSHNVITTDHLSFINGIGASWDGKLFTCDPDRSIQMMDAGKCVCGWIYQSIFILTNCYKMYLTCI